MSDARMSELDLQKFWNKNSSSKGDPWGAFGGALVGAGCVTALIVGGVIALPAMPAIATGVVIGGAIVGGGAVGAAVGAHLKKPIENLVEQPAKVLKNFPSTNVGVDQYLNEWIKPLGSSMISGAELLQKARDQNTGRPGGWKNFM